MKNFAWNSCRKRVIKLKLMILNIIIGGVLIFISYEIGRLVQSERDRKYSFDDFMEICKLYKEIEGMKRTTVNASDLIEWIESWMHNQEFVSPPTTGEIVKHIKEMVK